MSIEQEQHWITGEEFGRERRRLIEEGVPDEDPRFRDLYARVEARNDYLYERYGKHYFDTHRGKWIAISPAGETLIRDTAGEAIWAADEAFGRGNFSLRKLDEFPGHMMSIR
jgi:hypothetical protein